MKQYFNAVLSEVDKDYISVVFPDFLGCVSGGENIADAINNGKEALEFHLQGMIEDNEDIPLQSSSNLLQDFLLDAKKNNINCQIAIIDVELPDNTPQRVNISLPKYLLEKVDRYAKNNNMTRSAFLAKGAIKLITN